MKFVQISTDEVYGSLGQQGCFTEESRTDSNGTLRFNSGEAIMQITTSWHEKGRAEGLAENMEKGRIEGRIEGKQDVICKFMARRGCPKIRGN